MTRSLIDDFAAHVGVPADSLDAAQVDRLRIEAEALIRAVKPALPEQVDQWPENAYVVLLRVMARGVSRGAGGGFPSGIDRVSEGSGDFSYSYSLSEDSQGGGLWLTRQDRLILGVRGGAFAIDLGYRARVPGVAGGRQEW